MSRPRKVVLLALAALAHGSRVPAAQKTVLTVRQRRVGPVGRGVRRLAASTSASGLLLTMLMTPPVGAQVRMSPPDLDRNRDGQVDKMEFMFGVRDRLDYEGFADKDARKRAFEFADRRYHFCDLNGDGMLDLLEADFAEYLREVTAQVENQTGQQVALEEFGENGFEGFLRRIHPDTPGAIGEDAAWGIYRRELLGIGWPEELVNSDAIQAWMRNIFGEADLDGNGLFDAKEVQFLDFLIHRRMALEMASTINYHLDLNHDGVLEWEELARYVVSSQRRKPGETKSLSEYVRDEFIHWDFDRDGTLDLDEMDALAWQFILSARHREFKDAVLPPSTD